MKKVFFALAALTMVSPATAQPTLPWECRNARPAMPTLPTVARSEDLRRGYRDWNFEADNQTVFGLPVTYLSHFRNTATDDEYNFNNYGYIAVVRGDINHVRWLVERASPDLRCLPNGASFTCMLASVIGTAGHGTLPNDRTVSIFSPPSVEDSGVLITEGVQITCQWDEEVD